MKRETLGIDRFSRSTETRQLEQHMNGQPPLPRERPDPKATLRSISMYAAMRGSPFAVAEDNQYAEEIEREFPGTCSLMRAVGQFHSRAAAWAVTDGGCSGVLFGASGFPDPARAWHEEARRLAPGARFGYVTAHTAAARMCAVMYAGRASCWAATTLDPGALLDCPKGLSLGTPLSLHFHMLLHHLEGPTCAWMLGEYARRLRRRGPGSSMAVSCWLPGPGPEGHELAAMIAAAGWPLHAHSEDDLRQWIAGAGMDLHPEGITDVRDFGRRTGIRPCWRDRPEGRIVEAVALVRPLARGGGRALRGPLRAA